MYNYTIYKIYVKEILKSSENRRVIGYIEDKCYTDLSRMIPPGGNSNRIIEINE